MRAVFSFPDSRDPAERLAAALGCPCHPVELHRFPDGESRVRVPAGADEAILYRSLDDPNARLIELMLASGALRDQGAGQIVLVAPYLCYMRQDMAFRPGEAVSQRLVGRFLGQWFDRVVTVDPHLHRVHDLGAVVAPAAATVLSAAPLIANHLRASGIAPETLIVGPDSEARQWVEAIARPLGLDILIGEKIRSGDRDVRIGFPENTPIAGRPVILVDDVISSGTTLAEAARLLLARGARSVEVFATHALHGEPAAAVLGAAGITRVTTTDAVPHPTSRIPIASLLASAL